MKNLQIVVKQFLEEHQEYRERKYRALAVWKLIEKLHFKELIELGQRDFIQWGFKQIQSLNRLINKVQADYISLRGTDYNDKKKLQQKVKVELGYSPGIDQQIKMLSKIQ